MKVTVLELKVYGLFAKIIRYFYCNYTVCESKRSWIIDESYDEKRKVHGPSLLSLEQGLGFGIKVRD